jgi:transposase
MDSIVTAPSSVFKMGRLVGYRTRNVTCVTPPANPVPSSPPNRSCSDFGSGRMDKPRANTATAHKLARMVYFMLTRGETYVDQGQQQYEEQQRQRSIAALKRRAAALGFAVMPTTTPA